MDDGCCIPLTPDLASSIKADDGSAVVAIFSSVSASVCVSDEECRFDPILRQRPPLLCVCCYYGATRCIDSLLNAGASGGARDRHGRGAHHFAAAGNQVGALVRIREALFQQTASTDSALLSKDCESWTVLHFAAQADAVAVFQYFFARLGPSTIFDVQSRAGTPLQIACRYHSIKCIRFLAELNLAAMQNRQRVDAVKLPIDFNQESPKAPIVLLLQSGAYEVIPLAVRAGMDVNYSVGNGWPVIFHAIRMNAVNFTRLLCHIGACPNWRCQQRWTPFHIAAQERLPAVCRLLWEFGGCPHSLTEFGHSPFTLAKPIEQRDPERQTAREVRAIMIEYFARIVMEAAATIVIASNHEDCRETNPLVCANRKWLELQKSRELVTGGSGKR
jgi:ankyrin repeat protein